MQERARPSQPRSFVQVENMGRERGTTQQVRYWTRERSCSAPYDDERRVIHPPRCFDIALVAACERGACCAARGHYVEFCPQSPTCMYAIRRIVGDITHIPTQSSWSKASVVCAMSQTVGLGHDKQYYRAPGINGLAIEQDKAGVAVRDEPESALVRSPWLVPLLAGAPTEQILLKDDPASPG